MDQALDLPCQGATSSGPLPEQSSRSRATVSVSLSELVLVVKLIGVYSLVFKPSQAVLVLLLVFEAGSHTAAQAASRL